MGRGDVDDPAPALLLHRRNRQADGVKGAGEIDRQDRIPLLDRELLDRGNMLDAGIVDEDVDAAELAAREVDHGGDVAALADVGAAEGDADVVRPRHLRPRLLDRRRVAEAVDDDIGASAGERLGDAEPDAARRSRYDGRLACEHLIPWRLSWASARSGDPIRH
jgi:hypothetical protein